MTSTTELERRYRVWVTKLQELVDTHDLSLDVGMSWRTETVTGRNHESIRSVPYLMFYTARADHVDVFKGLGMVTGWFTIEQAESMQSTLWHYEIKLLVK